MAGKVKVWFDPEADYLEVQFREAPGFMRSTTHDAVMERVDEKGQVLGVSQFRKDQPLEAELAIRRVIRHPRSFHATPFSMDCSIG